MSKETLAKEKINDYFEKVKNYKIDMLSLIEIHSIENVGSFLANSKSQIEESLSLVEIKNILKENHMIFNLLNAKLFLYSYILSNVHANLYKNIENELVICYEKEEVKKHKEIAQAAKYTSMLLMSFILGKKIDFDLIETIGVSKSELDKLRTDEKELDSLITNFLNKSAI